MIYHYTTLETLRHLLTPGDGLEIIDYNINMLFHATGAQFLNDAKENQILPTALRELGVPSEALFTIDEVKGLPYVISFSKDADNLAMWRNYANDGHGVALGFNEDYIKESLKNESIDFMGECEYVTLEALIERIKEDALFQEYEMNTSILNSLFALYSQSLKYKHVTFADEREYRITFSRHTDENFKSKKNEIATYQVLRIPFTALQTIVVGPCLDFDKTKFSITRMLYRYLYGYPDNWKLIIASMYKSEAPYVSKEV